MRNGDAFEREEEGRERLREALGASSQVLQQVGPGQMLKDAPHSKRCL